MKLSGWSTPLRWKWENTGQVVVFSSGENLRKHKLLVIKCLKDMLQEFQIPLNVIDGHLSNNDDLAKIIALIQSNQIEFDSFVERLGKIRKLGQLRYGIVLLLDKEYLPIKQQGFSEVGEFGMGDSNGVVLLREFHREAVRHEFGHMLGLTHHEPPKPECIMKWECEPYNFCDECKQKLSAIESNS